MQLVLSHASGGFTVGDGVPANELTVGVMVASLLMRSQGSAAVQMRQIGVILKPKIPGVYLYAFHVSYVHWR